MVDVELFPRTEQKIAVLGYRLAKYHALPDGNKRTAWFAMRFAADVAGLTIRSTADEAVQVMKDIASGAMDEPAFHRWIASHIDTAA